jgi:hypothetical protein
MIRLVPKPPEFKLTGEQIAAGLVRVAELRGDDDEDTQLLKEMADEAKGYISSFSWCRGIVDSYFGAGVGKIFAVFFFRIQPARSGVDQWIWASVGDVPRAYMPLMDCSSPAEFFSGYIRGMRAWVALARVGQEGTPEQGVPPVNLPATPEWAEKLDQRLEGLISVIGPYFDYKDRRRFQ